VKVLVTGGAGYIGSHAVRELRDAGHDVVVLDNMVNGFRAALPADVPLFVGDIADEAMVDRALHGVDAVMHFAGLLSVGQSVSDPTSYYRVNVASGLTLLTRMLQAGVRKMIFSSTCAVYGMPVQVPMDEDHPQDPINPYGASKRAYERLLQDHARAGQLRAVALRYFNAAGCHPDGSLGEDHRPEEHILPRAIDAALGRAPALFIHGDDYETEDGTCIRDYVHVQDLAIAHVAALAALEQGDAYQVSNLGTTHGNSVRQVLRAVEEVSGLPVPAKVGPRRPGDPPRLLASGERARRLLGFQPRHDLRAIVEHTLRWRRAHPEGYGERG
jgi:UDP-glucose-4-epimerase GalE